MYVEEGRESGKERESGKQWKDANRTGSRKESKHKSKRKSKGDNRIAYCRISNQMLFSRRLLIRPVRVIF